MEKGVVSYKETLIEKFAKGEKVEHEDNSIKNMFLGVGGGGGGG